MQAVRGTHSNTSQRTKVSGWHEAKDAEDTEDAEDVEDTEDTRRH